MNARSTYGLGLTWQLFIVVSVLGAGAGASCWAKNAPQEPVVGFNIGITHLFVILNC